MLASGLVLWSALLTVCVLAVPGFVMGAEAPDPRVPAVTASVARPLTEPLAEMATVDGDQDTAAAVDDPVIAMPEGPTQVAATAAEVSAGTLLAVLPWGEGAGQVGLAAPSEGLVRGPEAVAVAPDGRIAVLDSVNHRLVLLDAQGSYTSAAPVLLAEPRFLAATDEHLYVLDCDRDRALVALTWDGAEAQRLMLPLLNDVVTGLFATKHGPCVEVAHESAFLLKSNGKLSPALPGRPLDPSLRNAAKATFAPGQAARFTVSTVDERTIKATNSRVLRSSLVRGRAVEHLVSVDGDGREGLIVGARLRTDETEQDRPGEDSRGRAALVLTRLSAASETGNGRPAASTTVDGEAVVQGELLLADCAFAYLGQPYVVTPDGRVIQPVADEEGYRLMIHSFAMNLEVQP